MCASMCFDLCGLAKIWIKLPAQGLARSDTELALIAGPSGCALAAIPVCLACAGVAYFLGLHHEQLAAKQSRTETS